MQDFFLLEEELDNFQTQLIQRSINSKMAVTGCAGSGKSIIALWKAKQINDMGKSFYFVVYTKVLKQYFDDGIQQINDPALDKMKKMLQDETKFFYYDNWKIKAPLIVDYMVVDEAQDFNKEDVENLMNSAKISTWFFGDTKQSLFKFNKDTLSMGQIANMIGEESPYNLSHNYRLPKKIARVVDKICNSDLEWHCVKEGEHLPEKIQCPSYFAQLDKIMEIVTEQNLKNVGILFPYNSYTTTKKLPDVHSAYDYFKNKGFNIDAKFDFNKPELKFKQTFKDLKFSSDNPKLMTYHSSKGLQFEAVFIPEPTLWGDKDPLTPLYVAMTRASDRLYFLYSGGEPTIFDTVPANLFKNDDDIIQL